MRSGNAFKLFMVLLLIVDRNTGKWSGGRFQLAKIAKLKNSSTYKALLRLQKLEIVTLKSNNRFSTIYICKWKEYQPDSNTKLGQQSNNKAIKEEHSYKNIKNKNKEYSKNLLQNSSNPIYREYMICNSELEFEEFVKNYI